VFAFLVPETLKKKKKLPLGESSGV
jgi:hypothetical protein